MSDILRFSIAVIRHFRVVKYTIAGIQTAFQDRLGCGLAQDAAWLTPIIMDAIIAPAPRCRPRMRSRHDRKTPGWRIFKASPWLPRDTCEMLA